MLSLYINHETVLLAFPLQIEDIKRATFSILFYLFNCKQVLLISKQAVNLLNNALLQNLNFSFHLPLYVYIYQKKTKGIF